MYKPNDEKKNLYLIKSERKVIKFKICKCVLQAQNYS